MDTRSRHDSSRSAYAPRVRSFKAKAEIDSYNLSFESLEPTRNEEHTEPSAKFRLLRETSAIVAKTRARARSWTRRNRSVEPCARSFSAATGLVARHGRRTCGGPRLERQQRSGQEDMASPSCR